MAYTGGFAAATKYSEPCAIGAMIQSQGFKHHYLGFAEINCKQTWLTEAGQDVRLPFCSPSLLVKINIRLSLYSCNGIKLPGVPVHQCQQSPTDASLSDLNGAQTAWGSKSKLVDSMETGQLDI